MRKRLGILVAACLDYSGLVGLARWLMRRSGPRLIILNYHRASGGDLRRHLVYLRRHYRMLHLDEALEELYGAGKPQQKMHRDRRSRLVLTFDDGYRDNYTHAFPLACALGVPITIFLVPGYLESGNCFWWLEGAYLARRVQAEQVTLEGHTYDLRLPGGRQQLAQAIDSRLRHAPTVAEREAFLLDARMAVCGCDAGTAPDEDERPLTLAEVCEMQQSGWVSFGAHTMHHPILAYLVDPAEVQYEVGACRSVLQGWLRCPVRTFAYPVGRSEHIGDAALEAVREAGYGGAVTTMHGTNSPQSDPLRLGRVLGDVSRHWLVMAAETSGIWQFFSPLWQSLVGKGPGV